MASEPLTLTDVLSAFTLRGIWPGSLKIAQTLMKKYHTVADLQKYVATHYPVHSLSSTPSWVVKALSKEMGNQVGWLKIAQLAPILLQSASGHWTSDKTQAALQATPWWQSHNQQQKQWLVTTEADRNVMRQQAAQQMASTYDQLYGTQTDPSVFLKNPSLERVSSGAISLDQWTAEQRNTPEYKARYPGNAARQAAKLPVLDEAQYRSLEDQYKQQMSQYGIDPKQFDNPADLTSFFARDMQPGELGQRLDAFRTLEGPAGQFVRQQFAANVGLPNLSSADMYGILSGQRPDLVAHYAKQTGTSTTALPSLYDVTQSLQKAESANKAEFSSGGQVAQNEPTAQSPQNVPMQKEQTF